MENDVEARDVVADTEARADGILIEQQLVVIPAKAGADGPFTKSNLILDESGLLKIRFVSSEIVCLGRVGIELSGIGDEVVEALVKEGGIGFDADLDVVAALVNGDGAFEIAFAEVVVLERDDRQWRGGWSKGRWSCREPCRENRR